MLSMSELEQSRKTAETILKWMERLQGVHDLFVEAKVFLGERQALETALAVHTADLTVKHREWTDLEAALAPLRAELAGLPEAIAQQRAAYWADAQQAADAELQLYKESVLRDSAGVQQELWRLEGLKDALELECAVLQEKVLEFRRAMDAARDQAAALMGV